MAYPTIEQLETDYKDFVALTKANPKIAGETVLLNQRLLTAAGRIHQHCSEKQYQDFVQNTFVGTYYNQWRKNRAVSIVDAMGIYDQLNVCFGIDDYHGETFYAGIPPTTQAEIDAAKIATDDAGYEFWPVSEKIGIDGKYHPVDANGEFCPMLNENDIYGDNTHVTIDKMRPI